MYVKRLAHSGTLVNTSSDADLAVDFKGLTWRWGLGEVSLTPCLWGVALHTLIHTGYGPSSEKHLFCFLFISTDVSPHPTPATA